MNYNKKKLFCDDSFIKKEKLKKLRKKYNVSYTLLNRPGNRES